MIYPVSEILANGSCEPYPRLTSDMHTHKGGRGKHLNDLHHQKIPMLQRTVTLNDPSYFEHNFFFCSCDCSVRAETLSRIPTLVYGFVFFLFALLNTKSRGWRDGWAVKSTCRSYQTQVWFRGPTWWLTQICNYNSKESLECTRLWALYEALHNDFSLCNLKYKLTHLFPFFMSNSLHCYNAVSCNTVNIETVFCI